MLSSQAHTKKQMEKCADQIATILASGGRSDEILPAIREVRGGTDECVERLAGLYDFFVAGVSNGTGPEPRKPTSGSRRGSAERQLSSGPGNYSLPSTSPSRKFSGAGLR